MKVIVMTISGMNQKRVSKIKVIFKRFQCHTTCPAIINYGRNVSIYSVYPIFRQLNAGQQVQTSSPVCNFCFFLTYNKIMVKYFKQVLTHSHRVMHVSETYILHKVCFS